jgi:metal-sulfur cluster biosynthetic enzyme
MPMATETTANGAGDITQERVLELLSGVLDPEVRINIVDLGLVSRVGIGDAGIEIDFTLTYPGCPLGDTLVAEIERAVRDGTGVEDVRARVVWEPPWSEERMSEAARLEMGYPI